MSKLIHYTLVGFFIFSLSACQQSSESKSDKVDLAVSTANNTLVFVSDDGKFLFSLQADPNSEGVFLLADLVQDKTYHLKHVEAASGAKYSDDKGNIFWTKGDNFTWMKAGEIIASGQLERNKKESNYVSDDEADPDQIDPTVFRKVLDLQGIGFSVSSIRLDNGMTDVSITPFGLEIDNSVQNQTIEGSVVDAEVEDLNADGSPELIIYTLSDGSGSYGNVITYTVNNRKSMSMVYFPPISENETLSKGYLGHDEFRIVENMLVQRFPIYNEGDSNANPTGGIRQISYKLVEGEAMRRFEVKDITKIDRTPLSN